jgi:hypothetical protein
MNPLNVGSCRRTGAHGSGAPRAGIKGGGESVAGEISAVFNLPPPPNPLPQGEGGIILRQAHDKSADFAEIPEFH